MAIMAEALRYIELTEGGDLVGFKVGFKESGSVAFVAQTDRERLISAYGPAVKDFLLESRTRCCTRGISG